MSVFTNEDNISFYLLGAFITDGCVYKNNKNTYACQLSSIDYEWLRKIADIIGQNLKIHQFSKGYFGIRITRNDISQWFINRGCLPRKTYNVVLPDIPDQYFPDFIRGCIDGDGSIGTYYYKNNAKRVCQLISASQIFLQQIQEKLKTKDIYSTIVNRGKCNSVLNNKHIIAKTDSFSLVFNRYNCFKLLEMSYYNNHQISLNRKYLKAKEIIDFYHNACNLSNLLNSS